MPYTRPYASGFQDFPDTTTPINATALNTIDVGVKTANDQFQTVTTAQRAALTPTVGQAVWDSDLRQLMVFMNAAGGNAWQPVGNTIVCTSTTRPSTPFEGQQIRETDTNRELVYSGAAWVQTNSWGTTSGVTGVNNLIVPPIIKLRRSTAQTIANATDTLVEWTIEDIDNDGCYTSGGTISIQTAGVYVVSAGLVFASNATGQRAMQVTVDSTNVSTDSTIISVLAAPNGSGATGISGSTVVSLAAGAVLRVYAYQSTSPSVSLDISASSSGFARGATHFSAAWIGRAS